jgi:hypothetical protein
MAEVTALVDKYGECRARSAHLYEFPDSRDILSDALGTPDYHGQLAGQCTDLGATMGRLILEFCRHENILTRVTDNEVGAEGPVRAWQHRVVVEHLVPQHAFADQFAQPGLHSPDQVSFDPELELPIVLA